MLVNYQVTCLTEQVSMDCRLQQFEVAMVVVAQGVWEACGSEVRFSGTLVARSSFHLTASFLGTFNESEARSRRTARSSRGHM